MSNDTPSYRGYDENEIGALIQRATELQEKESGSAGESARRLSLQEIEHIAKELGLSSEHLNAAATELEQQRRSRGGRSFWGAPFVVGESKIVDGDLTEEQWEDIVYELQRFSGRTGKITEIGRTRQWSHYVGEGDEGLNFTKILATARSRNGQTSIEIQKHFGIAGALYPIALVMSIVFSFIVVQEYETALGAVIGLGIIPASLGVVRMLISRWAKKHSRNMSRLADRLNEALKLSTADNIILSASNVDAELESSTPEEVHTGIEISGIEISEEENTDFASSSRRDRTRS